MSKVIKVEDQVYEDLDQLRTKGETFSQVIAVLLGARVSMLEVMNILEGSLKFRQWQEDRLRKLQAGPEEG